MSNAGLDVGRGLGPCNEFLTETKG